MQKTLAFHVDGMHCAACVALTESELSDVPYITRAKSSLMRHAVEVTGDFGDRTPEAVAQELTKVLEPRGYSLSVEKRTVEKNWADFKFAVPIAIAFGIFFVLLQKMGLVNLISAGDVSYGTAFVIGIVASLSTCMAVVGGLVLSISATFAREGDPTSPKLRRAGAVQPHLMFHVGRLIAFFVLGGVIGALGSAFQLSAFGTFAIGLLVASVMLILGINLLDVFHFTKRFQVGMPSFVSKHALGVSAVNHTLTPLLIGIATFFLPCGFTQAMQIYTLSTGSFLAGALTMLFFALGTLPVLSLISFSSFSIRNSKMSGVFFKTAGLIVILFAVFNIINSFVVIGLIPPVFNF